MSMPVGFLTKDPDTRKSMDVFKASEAIVHTLAVTNDRTQQGVATMRYTKSEELLQLSNRVEKAFPV